MTFPRALAAAIGAALIAAAACERSAAQSLPRLTVQSLAISSDNLHPALEVPFHLIVTAHVRERVAAIDTIELPILAELELLGDVRGVQTGPSGTDYRETITVVAHHTGTIEIAPVTLQVVDARDGKPKQYYSNTLTLQVGGGALQPFAAGGSAAAALLRILGRAALWLGGIACTVAVVALLFSRRAPPIPQAVPISAPAPVPPRSRRDQLSDAFTVLRTERDRRTAIFVRGVVWRMMGASEGETLSDVLTRQGTDDPHMNDLLVALERAAFTYDADLRAAIDRACDAFERYLA